MPLLELIIGTTILLVLLAFFIRVEATRLVINPIVKNIPFKFYVVATGIVLAHTFLLVVTIPIALFRKMRGD